MPIPILAGLAGLASAVGAGAGAYGLGTSIKDRNAIKKQQKQAASAAKKRPFGPSGNSGFTPSAQPNSFWSGQPAGMETFNQYTPEQQAAFSQVLQQALGGLGKNQFDFTPIEAQARRGFAEKTIPGIAERFSSLGAQKSSAFGQQLGAAGAGLEGDLAAMRQNYGLQQQQMLHNLLGIGLQPQFESIYRPGSEGFGRSLTQDLIRNLLTGENVAGAAGALKSSVNALRNRNNSTSATDAADALYNQQQQQSPQFKYNTNPTTMTGSTQAIYNPGNIVAGIQNPTAPYVPPINASGGIGNVSAMQGLYGLQRPNYFNF